MPMVQKYDALQLPSLRFVLHSVSKVIERTLYRRVSSGSDSDD